MQKDLRLPLTSAIDKLRCHPAREGWRDETNATGLGRTEYQYTRQNCRFRERSLGKYTRCSASCVVLESRGIMQNFVPSVIGMGEAKDAVYLLESKGLKVNLVGVGKVKSQSIANGTIIRKGQTITLTMN